MADYTWADRELVILEAVRAAEEAGMKVGKAASECLPDLDSRRHSNALVALIDDGYLTGSYQRSWGGEQVRVSVSGITAKGRREVGQWPKEDPVVAFQQALQAAIDREPDGERKTKLGRVMEAVTALGAEALKAVVSAATSAALGR